MKQETLERVLHNVTLHPPTHPAVGDGMDRIRDAGKTAILLSNDASRSVASSWRRYSGYGLRIDPDQIITSGLNRLSAHCGRCRLPTPRAV